MPSQLTDLVARATHALIELDTGVRRITVDLDEGDASIAVYGQRCDRGHIHVATERREPWSHEEAIERMFDHGDLPDV